MSGFLLEDLRESINDLHAFKSLSAYHQIASNYLRCLHAQSPTRIVAPNRPHYIFYQYTSDYQHRITRPLNSRLWFEDPIAFDRAFERFIAFLDDVARYEGQIIHRDGVSDYLQTHEIDRVIYTCQQSIGCISDAFPEVNQARKRIGQLFETLMTLILRAIGLACESRTIHLPIQGGDGLRMSYELDLVFSRPSASVSAQSPSLDPHEVVGSVKTTSKDRIDKIFIDKHLMSRLTGRDVPVIALFLHDVQRAKRGQSIFGVQSTFNTNHFLGYSLVLNQLDGTYYIDLAPDIASNPSLSAQIRDFQQFIVTDVWRLLDQHGSPNPPPTA
jgi:hypothetical protein